MPWLEVVLTTVMPCLEVSLLLIYTSFYRMVIQNTLNLSLNPDILFFEVVEVKPHFHICVIRHALYGMRYAAILTIKM